MRRACAIACALVGMARADEHSPSTPAPTVGMTEPYWLTYAAWRNDVFTELDTSIDDQGFTHDNVLALRRQQGDYTFGGVIVQRWITSRTDRRRWDLGQLFATGERAWLAPLAPLAPLALEPQHTATITLRAGPAIAGNLGGRYLQNGWHSISKSGPTLEQGLQNHYPDDHRFGFVLGARARGALGDRIQGYGFVDGQLALGNTGVTSFESALGVSAASAHLGIRAEVAVTRYHVGDVYLALPGGYGGGWQVEWRVGIDVHWSRFRIGYEYRANEGGSGEPIGVVEFSSRR